jgi:histidinol-phosphate aminotransferase
MIFLCSPNNPTSNLLETDEILKILERFRGIVVLDEAYIDFTRGKGLIHYLDKSPNLVILRTLSKAWGAAGIRLGLALGNAEVVKLLYRVKYPYNVNLLTQNKAIEIIENPRQKQEWVELILSERDWLAEKLAKLDSVIRVFPSDANFLLIRVKDADALYQYLADGGIIVRNRSGLKHCEGCLRVTVGTKEENRKLLKLMKTY